MRDDESLEDGRPADEDGSSYDDRSSGWSPPEAERDLADGAPPERRRARWPWYVSGIGLMIVAVAAAGRLVRLPYYTISPGSSLDVNERVTVSGAPSYEPEGEVRLLFVRQRARVNVWRWLAASLDPDVDLYKERGFTGGQSPERVRDEARADMLVAQFAARTVALRTVGYDLEPERKGASVLYVFSDLPASNVLATGDLIIRVDGIAVRDAQELGRAIGRHKAGESVKISFVRDGERRTVEVSTDAAFDDGRAIIGVQAVPPYDFPVDIKIDTDRIGGPSAGLAMTLSIIDELTPGELTGGKIVAVTGTIELTGNVGPIGGIAQKAGSARSAHADLFLVPACPKSTFHADCEHDLDRARSRAGDMEIEEVATVKEALRALEVAGGDPLQPTG